MSNILLTKAGMAYQGSGSTKRSANFGTSGGKYLQFNTVNTLGIGSGNYSYATSIKMNTDLADGDTVYLFIDALGSSIGNYYFCTYSRASSTYTLSTTRSKRSVADNVASATISALGTSVWHRVYVTYDGSTLKLYLDGSQIASVGATGTGTRYLVDNSEDYFGINNRQGGGFGFCLQDEFQCWSADKSGIVATDYSAPTQLAGNETNLRAYYSFDSSLTADATANVYNLTNTGATQSTDVPF